MGPPVGSIRTGGGEGFRIVPGPAKIPLGGPRPA
jgi:hypothetical protein